MTRAQHQKLNKLRKKQSNHNEVEVVEVCDGAATFYVPFPGLYLTYSNDGKLLLTETIAEREQRGGRPVGAGAPAGEMGSDAVPVKRTYAPPDDLDDDVPF